MKTKLRKITCSLFHFIVLLSILCLYGCGYKPFTPLRSENIRDIYIPTFKNSTYYAGISAAVTDTLRREIILDGTFNLEDKENAQAILTGEVTDYRRTPLIYNEEENIIGGNLTIEITARFVSLPERKILWEEEFTENESVNYFLAGNLAKTEEEVTEWVADKIARRIVERITEHW